ncbi:MAG: DinB family protein [Acidimicrobiales bacterium]
MEDNFDYSEVQLVMCPECGHDVAVVPDSDLAPALVDAGRKWFEFTSSVLDYPGGGEDLRTRPTPATWSAIEYGCHVRDVLSLFGRRVELALLAHRPEFVVWDHEAAVAAHHYAEQDPSAVADDIEVAAAELAATAQRLPPAALARSGTRDGVEFTVGGLIRFALHEMLHHLEDARTVVPAPAA